jgi:hypothetical protein
MSRSLGLTRKRWFHDGPRARSSGFDVADSLVSIRRLEVYGLTTMWTMRIPTFLGARVSPAAICQAIERRRTHQNPLVAHQGDGEDLSAAYLVLLSSGSLRSPALQHRRARKGHLPCTNSHEGWTDESDPVSVFGPEWIFRLGPHARPVRPTAYERI